MPFCFFLTGCWRNKNFEKIINQCFNLTSFRITHLKKKMSLSCWDVFFKLICKLRRIQFSITNIFTKNRFQHFLTTLKSMKK